MLEQLEAAGQSGAPKGVRQGRIVRRVRTLADPPIEARDGMDVGCRASNRTSAGCCLICDGVPQHPRLGTRTTAPPHSRTAAVG